MCEIDQIQNLIDLAKYMLDDEPIDAEISDVIRTRLWEIM